MSEVVKVDEEVPRPASLSELMQELANKRGRPVLLVNHDMDWDCVGEVRGVADKLDNAGTLTVLVNSLGGDIRCAYLMLLALRDRVRDIEILAPGYAKSAATFFCLGADSIHMGRYGELGPLDMQIVDRSSGRTVQTSALETFKTLEGLLDYSVDSLNVIVQFLRSAPMDVPHALDNARQLFAVIASPLYGQIDPRELGAMGRYMSISEEYSMRVMRRWAYSDLSYAGRYEMARRLIWSYPDHGFVIDLIEAQEIGLKAERLDAKSDMICETIVAVSENSVKFQPYAPDEAAAQSSKAEKEDDVPVSESPAETPQAKRRASALRTG